MAWAATVLVASFLFLCCCSSQKHFLRYFSLPLNSTAVFHILHHCPTPSYNTERSYTIVANFFVFASFSLFLYLCFLLFCVIHFPWVSSSPFWSSWSFLFFCFSADLENLVSHCQTSYTISGLLVEQASST